MKFTKIDLKNGDKLTLRNGSVGYYNGDEYIVSGLRGSDINDDLTNKGCIGNALDIVKVERPVFEKLYEREEVREMTIEEICRELGYKVKVVKGD